MSNQKNSTASCREVPDLANNEYLDLSGEVITFQDIEWLEDSRGCSRYLIDDDSVWLNEDFVEVEH